MIADLEFAKGQSADIPDAPPIDPVTRIYTGQPGRPRIEIDPDVLATSMQFCGPTALAQVFDVGACTVCR
jgi:hypothetical protein